MAGSSELDSTLVFIAAIMARRESYVAPRRADLLFRRVFRFGRELDVRPRPHLRSRPFPGIAAGPARRLLVHPMSGRAAVPEPFVFYVFARIVGHGGGFYPKQRARSAADGTLASPPAGLAASRCQPGVFANVA